MSDRASIGEISTAWNNSGEPSGRGWLKALFGDMTQREPTPLQGTRGG